jgi:hypothetical protein
MLSQAIDIKLDTRHVAQTTPWNAGTYRTALLTYLTVKETYDLQFRMSTSSSQLDPIPIRQSHRQEPLQMHSIALTVLFRKEKTNSLQSGETKHCQDVYFCEPKATIIQICAERSLLSKQAKLYCLTSVTDALRLEIHIHYNNPLRLFLHTYL